MRTKRAKKSLTDQAAELVEQVQPHVDAARERIVNDYLPAAQSMLADAREVAREVAQDAREAAQEAATTAEKSTRKSRRRAARKARAKASELATRTAEAAPFAAPLATRVADKVEPKPRRRKRVLLLVIAGGAAAVVAKRLRAGTPATAPYTPPPRPSAVPDPAVSTTPPPPAPSDTHFEPDPEAPAETTDQGGAFLDEVLADSAEEPHKVTTPDAPADVESVTGEPSGARHSRKG
ncbi:MAG TPA: hypothetical protein VFE07_00685 [Marmoricola sp.]|nr:hypothetical protein [Marmoricola sp.]